MSSCNLSCATAHLAARHRRLCRVPRGPEGPYASVVSSAPATTRCGAVTMTHRIAVRGADVVSADGHLGLPPAALRTHLLAVKTCRRVWSHAVNQSTDVHNVN
jgi:hypothetical protein